MEEGRFVAWLRKDGDLVPEGEPLFTVEGDKATQDVEALSAGVLRIAADGPAEGDTIEVGRVLGWILAPGESIPTTQPAGTWATAAASTATAPTAPAAPTDGLTTDAPSDPPAQPPSGPGPSERPPASPRARRAARQHGIDLATLSPTGRGGRLRERDVLTAAAGRADPGEIPGVPQGWTSVPTPPMRRIIAARLMQARRETVPVTLTARADATALMALRRHLKSEAAPGESAPTLNDLLLKLTAEALSLHPMIAAVWAEDRLLLPRSIHLGLAVDTEAGLRVPVVRDVGTSTLEEIAAATRRLIAEARSGRIAPADLQGGCFTLTNLGSLGIEAFTPVPNPPESAILGVGTIVRDVVALEDGGFAARERLTLSLTFDHRVNDGAAAARFLQSLRRLIENPPFPIP